MIKTEERTIAEEKLVIVEYECDHCGRKANVDALPNDWVELRTKEGQYQACQPACYLKILSMSPTAMEEGTFERSLIDYVKPLFAKGELD